MAATPKIIQVVLPESSLNILKCDLCQGILSVSPICFAEDKYTCGRCRTTGNRVIIYEELAKSMIFPCIYEKCKVQILWGQVLNHELNCAHRTVQCPVGSCKKTPLQIRKILNHFEDCHKATICTNEITIPRRLRDLPLKNFNPDRKVFLINKNNVPYLVMAYLDCNLNKNGVIKGYRLAFGVYSMRDNNSKSDNVYQVDLLVKHKEQQVLYSWENQEIKLFDDRCHCFDCFTGNCTVPYHKNDKKNFLTSQVDDIPKKSDMNVKYTIQIKTKECRQEKCLSRPPVGGIELDNILCSLCREVMYAPIYACKCGQTYCCSGCERKLLPCLECGKTFGPNRNLTLEKFAENLLIPCQNISRGCQYTGLVRRTKQHVINCKYNFL